MDGRTDIGFHRRSGQASLEMAAALVVVLLLLVAAARIFVWLNERVVARQADYEASRVAAGSMPDTPVVFSEGTVTPGSDTIYGGVEVNESGYPEINLVN